MKIKTLKIQDFRGFSRFEMRNLGRVNLIVGTNNSGKTTILEAINILMATEDVAAIWSTLARRGEDIWAERGALSSAMSMQVDICRLFRGHKIEVGTSFQLSAETDFGGAMMIARIEDNREGQQPLLEPYSDAVELSEDFLLPLSLSLSWSNNTPRGRPIPISRRGGISTDVFRQSSRRTPAETDLRLRFVPASSMSADEVASLFEDVVLQPEEDLVTEAMRIIEPTIERIAPAASNRRRAGYATRGGIVVRLKDVPDRVPIGSMGDGIWRMLGLALSIVQAKNGILMVDDIDTGLHHTVMEDMWRLIYRSAKEFNVQVFATTHSRDCFQSLAAISHANVYENSDITIHRSERGREQSVAYTEQEIVAAALHGTEVR